MGILRDDFNNHKSNLQTDINQMIDDYYNNLADYNNKDQDKQDTIDFYNNKFNELTTAINNYFAYNDQRNKDYNSFLSNWFGAKSIWRYDFPETNGIENYFAFNFNDKYRNDLCIDYFNLTANDLWGGAYKTNSTTGEYEEEPDPTNFDNAINLVNNLFDNKEHPFFKQGQDQYMSVSMPAVMKLMMYGDMGQNPPQKTTQNPFPRIDIYMNDYGMNEKVEEFGLNVPNPNDLIN